MHKTVAKSEAKVRAFATTVCGRRLLSAFAFQIYRSSRLKRTAHAPGRLPVPDHHDASSDHPRCSRRATCARLVFNRDKLDLRPHG
jgi:hypothetical protein